ncbi:MAG: GIY-YIG nuclease family protein [Chloroflexia bacterium]|nr:GIY-YIG nuclease family protein [Chloroflexia bacterium]
MDTRVSGTEGEPSGPVPAAPSHDYLHLARRAEAFVRDQGGSAPEDALVGHVFGGTGSVSLWRPLLRQVLGNDEHLCLRADGRWMLTNVPGIRTDIPLSEFVAVDVETTGLRPVRQRITEVAIIRYQAGVEVERFVSLCNPRQLIPAYIAKLTGITNELVADAPDFSTIAAEVLSRVDGQLIIGHNVSFDVSFLNAELHRLDQPKLINERIDTMELATRLLTGVRKPSLEAIARILGIPAESRRAHRAAADAAVTAQVALRLAEMAQEQGYTTVDQLKGLGGPRSKPAPDGRNRGRSIMDRSMLSGIPSRPGVYLMRDAYDRIIYIGKAKNLRERVSSYYSQPLGYTRKMDGLLESITRIEVEVAGSELEALMLESQLIRRYQPRYNTALRSHEQYPFIRVDISNPWPRVMLAKSRRDDGARYFGPFRSATSARKTVDLINRIIPLRTCTRSFRDARSYGSPCLELDLGRCLGPCVARADRDTYMSLVRNVVSFLDGQDDALYQLLWSGLEEAAAKLDFERAARIRQELASVNSIVAAQRRLRDAIEGSNLLVVLPATHPDERVLLLVVNGRVWARFTAGRSERADVMADRLQLCWERLRRHGRLAVDHDHVDEANLLGRWLSVNAGHPALMTLPEAAMDVSWQEIAGGVFSIGLDDLVFDQRSVVDVETGQAAADAVGDRTLAVVGMIGGEDYTAPAEVYEHASQESS